MKSNVIAHWMEANVPRTKPLILSILYQNRVSSFWKCIQLYYLLISSSMNGIYCLLYLHLFQRANTSSIFRALLYRNPLLKSLLGHETGLETPTLNSWHSTFTTPQYQSYLIPYYVSYLTKTSHSSNNLILE